jgi:hypothetical protein
MAIRSILKCRCHPVRLIDGKITGWDKRIVLGDVSMTDVAVEERTDERGEDGEVGVSISAR